MKKIFLGLILAVSVFGASTPAFSDGCYICSGGSYVKYSGGDDGDKRKAAKQCGCQVVGTRGDCSAANLKVLCSVRADITEDQKIAQIVASQKK